ncbi:MAG: BLUF domain-containing protein [Rhodobiaceae bacterium]|nr:BLUF domain-containing protein [Rhodobiaceae bacterium]MCC0047784.1 BLUF domain-containing protein [Rhodobiaceae bacterium]
MYRLMYMSTAAPEMTDESVDILVDRARKKNDALNITGVIGFNGLNFAQILEGQKENILSLMNEIRSDNRHSGIIVTGEREVSKRAYPDFGMRRVHGLDFAAEWSKMQSD